MLFDYWNMKGYRNVCVSHTFGVWISGFQRVINTETGIHYPFLFSLTSCQPSKTRSLFEFSNKHVISMISGSVFRPIFTFNAVE